MKNIYALIRRRKSVRAYTDRPVAAEKLTRVLDAARFAPSCNNNQEWRFVVVRNRKTRQRLSEAACGQSFVGEAPVVLVCCAETNGTVTGSGQPSHLIDASIAVDHLTLAAAAEGLGTCWVGALDDKQVRKILDIPAQIVVITMLTIGYPKNPCPVDKRRLSLDEILHQEKW